jgi:hypothetical protein
MLQNLFGSTTTKKNLAQIMQPFQTLDYQAMIDSATQSKAEVEAEAKAAEKSLLQVQKFL